MKQLLFLVTLSFTTLISIAHAEEITNCRVNKTTNLRFWKEEIQVKSLAVTSSGTPITMKDILDDEMIHFRDQDGRISKTYQWMYGMIEKVQNREDKYFSSSYGEDVIITLGNVFDLPGHMTVSYVGTESGEYLSLNCEKMP